eukprot:TRINITY_DN475_c0_g1_i3.p1 TRINITY_DN475_c0_g1~~TRINITY_DN475_c0_g1_i3.p1  ORF type:complete len:672 (-),score=107.45 TRINITY_DN475_c0_g1_i3:61-2076(-)
MESVPLEMYFLVGAGVILTLSIFLLTPICCGRSVIEVSEDEFKDLYFGILRIEYFVISVDFFRTTNIKCFDGEIFLCSDCFVEDIFLNVSAGSCTGFCKFEIYYVNYIILSLATLLLLATYVWKDEILQFRLVPTIVSIALGVCLSLSFAVMIVYLLTMMENCFIMNSLIHHTALCLIHGIGITVQVSNWCSLKKLRDTDPSTLAAYMKSGRYRRMSSNRHWVNFDILSRMLNKPGKIEIANFIESRLFEAGFDAPLFLSAVNPFWDLDSDTAVRKRISHLERGIRNFERYLSNIEIPSISVPIPGLVNWKKGQNGFYYLNEIPPSKRKYLWILANSLSISNNDHMRLITKSIKNSQLRRIFNFMISCNTVLDKIVIMNNHHIRFRIDRNLDYTTGLDRVSPYDIVIAPFFGFHCRVSVMRNVICTKTIDLDDSETYVAISEFDYEDFHNDEEMKLEVPYKMETADFALVFKELEYVRISQTLSFYCCLTPGVIEETEISDSNSGSILDTIIIFSINGYVCEVVFTDVEEMDNYLVYASPSQTIYASFEITDYYEDAPVIPKGFPLTFDSTTFTFTVYPEHQILPLHGVVTTQYEHANLIDMPNLCQFGESVFCIRKFFPLMKKKFHTFNTKEKSLIVLHSVQNEQEIEDVELPVQFFHYGINHVLNIEVA